MDIYPCLWFDGNAKEAATFYCSVFENSKITSENPVVVNFQLNGFKFMGLNGGPAFTINPSVSFFVFCENENEVEKKWNQLSAGGKILMPLNKYPWSEKYGWCQDEYGVNWQLMIDKKMEQKIIPAFMFTQKNNGRAEEAINFYTSVFKNAEIKMISRYEKGEHDTEGNIKHAQFTLNDQWFVAMESSGPHDFTFNEGVSMVITCDTQEEIDYYWNKLTEGGTESQCGWLKDKYGFSWQVVPEVLSKLMSDPSKRENVMQTFMTMKKFDIQKLTEASKN
ncbi:MAG: VOC family protein [Ginsengibacter sp.]